MSVALPAQAFTVKVFAPAPAMSRAASIPASVSLPTPESVVGVSVKSTSPDSTTVSVPAPPSRRSSPARPEKVLSRVLPTSVSANTVPMAFSSPVAVESVTVKPVAIDCGVVTPRSSARPPLEIPEKSSVSASASADSTTVTLATRAPAKT